MGFNWGAAAAGLGVGLVTGNPMAGVATYGAMSASSAQDAANKQNVELQRETNAQSIDLSNTAHQREIADLKAAGLNPILSAKYGGSSTPSLGSPQVDSSAPVIQNSALAVNNAYLSKANLMADIELKKASVMNSSAQAVNQGQEARRRAMENDLLETEIENRKYESGRRKARPAWQKDLGIDVQDSIGSVLKPVVQLFK